MEFFRFLLILVAVITMVYLITLGLNQVSTFSTCIPNWNCNDWSACNSGTQTRTCTYLNNCGESFSVIADNIQPPTTQNCNPNYQTSFCGDGICNNGETCSTCSSDCGTCIFQDNREMATSLQKYQRPLVGGLQITQYSNSNQYMTCTLGAIIPYNGQNYFLTVEHCVVPNNVMEQGGNIIGSVYKEDSNLDIALVSINVSSEQKDYINNTIYGFGKASVGLKVYKIGRTTGLTYGTIVNTFSDSFLVKGDNGNFCDSGDSGSAIVTTYPPHKIIGILRSLANVNNTIYCDSFNSLNITNFLGLGNPN